MPDCDGVTLKDVKRRAKALGAIVKQDRIGDSIELTVEAAPGQCWEPGLHMFVSTSCAPWKPDYSDMLGRMATGSAPCEDSECEWCNPEKESES